MSLNHISTQITYYSTKLEHLTKHITHKESQILNIEQRGGLPKKADADLAQMSNFI